MAGSFTLSDLLGYASIGCWLGAQFPQVVENYRRGSCEGLALPFLANWLLGDISNLIGCLLTHQLPFQTWLATYFVFIDFMLVAQYLYYYKPTKAPPHFGHPRSTPGARRLSGERGRSHYRALSSVAANVAAAAALVAQHGEATPGSARIPRPLGYGTDDIHTGLRSSGFDDDDVDDAAMSALADSFHSEGGRRLGRKRPTYSIERHGRESSIGHYPPLPRVASSAVLTTEFLADEPHAQGSHEGEGDGLETPTTARRSSRASRRGAGMVFLGVWALFSVGSLTDSNRGVPSSSTNIGRVIFPQALFNHGNVPPAVVSRSPLGMELPEVASTNIRLDGEVISRSSSDEDDENDDKTPPPHEPHPEEPHFERTLGRIFAWLCTTLYLTSRLPQIWKNYVRKSVEGLSMYLFVFAFLGNSFYVASILLSPKTFLPPPASTDFIRESIPYLLGSAGTLMFDMTIVSQSFLYRPRPKRHLTTHSRLSISEEEAGLLSADALHPPLSSGEAAILNRGRTSRTRSVG